MDELQRKFIAGLEKWLYLQGNETYKYLAKSVDRSPQYITKIMAQGCGHRSMTRIAEKLGFESYLDVVKIGEDKPDQKQAPRQGEVIDINGVGQVLQMDQHVTDEPLGPALQAALAKLKAIYSSGDDVIIRAITENLNAFEKAVDYRKKVDELREHNSMQDGEIRHLKGQMSALMELMEGRKERRS